MKVSKKLLKEYIKTLLNEAMNFNTDTGEPATVAGMEMVMKDNERMKELVNPKMQEFFDNSLKPALNTVAKGDDKLGNRLVNLIIGALYGQGLPAEKRAEVWFDIYKLAGGGGLGKDQISSPGGGISADLPGAGSVSVGETIVSQDDPSEQMKTGAARALGKGSSVGNISDPVFRKKAIDMLQSMKEKMEAKGMPTAKLDKKIAKFKAMG